MPKHAFIFLLGIAILISGCKPCDNPTDPACPNYCQDPTNPDCPNYCQDPTNRDCPNYDPCYNKKPASAAFQMQEMPRFVLFEEWGFKPYDTDTALYRQIRFIADDPDADYYEWQIGANTYNTRSVSLSLSGMGSLLPIDIPARLIVHKEADTTCFPSDNGMDTVERSLHIIKDICEPLWEGTYQGYLEGDSPSDTFTVSLEHESPFSMGCTSGARLINWDRKGCNQVTPYVVWTAYRYMAGGGWYPCSYWRGYVWVNPKGDSIQAHYRLSVGRDGNNQPIYEDRVFNGKRIK